MSYLMGATACLEAHRQQPDNTASLSLARTMLRKSAEAAESLARSKLGKGVPVQAEDKMQIYHHILVCFPSPKVSLNYSNVLWHL